MGVLGILLTLACQSETKITHFSDTGAVGRPPPSDTGLFPNCFPMEGLDADYRLFPNSCMLVNTEGVSFSEEMTGFTLHGDPGIPNQYQMRVLADEDAINANSTYPLQPNFVSDYVLGSNTNNGRWKATASSTELGTLNSCEPNCVWELLLLEIADPDRAVNNECWQYFNGGTIHVCLLGHSPLVYWPIVRTQARLPTASICTPGYGRFQLIETRRFNIDGDLNETQVLSPIQVSGTGVLTADAVITSIAPVGDWGDSLKVLKGVDNHARIAPNDRIEVNNATVATVRAPLSNFKEGEVFGGTSFVLEEMFPPMASMISVDMEWTCPVRDPKSETHFAQGYTLSFSDIGCVDGWTQKLTLRPQGSSDYRWLTAELYGRPESSRKVPLTGVVGDEHFSVKIEGLVVEGKILSESALTGMLAILDRVEYQHISLCQPGQYTILAEH